jgi:O-antigen/teichoic acid export membrane protein
MSVTAEPEGRACLNPHLVSAGSLRERFTVGVLWSVAGAVISRGFTLAASIVCARFLGRTGFGELGMIQSTVGTFGVFAGLGLGLTATKYVAEFRDQDADKVGRILGISTVTALFSSAIMAALLVATAHFLATNTLRAPHLARALAVGAGLVFFGALNGAQTGALAGFEAFRAIARVNVWAGLSSFPLVVIGVWRWGLSGAVWGLVLAMAVNWFLNRHALRQECFRAGISCGFKFFYKEWRVLYKFSLPAFLASVVVGPALWICNMLLARQPNGYSQLGLYTAADRWRLLILFIPTSVFGMVVPMLSSLYGSGNESSFQRVFRANLLLNCCLALAPALVIAALAGPIMSLYGLQFRTGWPVLIVLAFAAIPEAINNIYMARLICAQLMWWRFALDLQLVTVLLLLAWWWIPRWGAIGMADAYVIALSALCFSQILLAQFNRIHAAKTVEPALGTPVGVSFVENTEQAQF